MSADTRRPAEEVKPIAEQMIEMLKPHCQQIIIGGSLRRGRQDIGDVELIALPYPTLHDTLDGMVKDGLIQKARYGAKQTTRWGKKLRGFLFQNIKFELSITDADNHGYLSWMRTGPDNDADRANTYLMTAIKRSAPFSVKDGYLWAGAQKLHVPTEEKFFALCGLEFVEPEKRSVRMYIALLGRNHKWGNPKQFVLQQLSLFSAAQLHEMEWQAAVRNEDKGRKKGYASAAPLERFDYQWGRPWVQSDGRMWIRQRQEWMLVEWNDPRAVEYRDYYCRAYRLIWDERKRLESWLEEQRTEQKLRLFLKEAIEILRGIA